jgi:hypothetical protein
MADDIPERLRAFYQRLVVTALHSPKDKLVTTSETRSYSLLIRWNNSVPPSCEKGEWHSSHASRTEVLSYPRL